MNALEALTSGSKLFQFLDEAGKARMAALARLERYAPGEIVFTEGDVGGAFYVVSKGQVAVDVDDDGKARRVATIAAGHFFGEMAALTRQPRSATVTALSDVELYAFDREPVRAILDAYPRVREVLGRVGVARSEDTLTKLLSSDEG